MTTDADDHIVGGHLGMALQVDAADHANKAYFGYCAGGDFRLQCCEDCSLLRYPPTTACPWCGHAESRFVSVEARGTVYSYAEVHHAIQPAFTPHLPYAILVVELDAQRARPQPHDALRVTGNLVDANGRLAAVEQVQGVGIGSRVRMVYAAAGDGIALPQWTLDATDNAHVWRYPEPLCKRPEIT